MNHFAEQIETHILSGCTYGQERAIGVEIETIIYNNDGERIPVNPCPKYSAVDVITDIESIYRDIGTYVTCSLEPGGQVEWASQPAFNLHDIQKEWDAIDNTIKSICTENQLTIIDLALEPIYQPSDIILINQRKYKLMHERFVGVGKYGPWMMRNTASVQVNIDLLDKQDAEECGFIADCISPLATILFSNAPFINNNPTGYDNMRYRIWEDTDPIRCGHLMNHGLYGSTNLLAQYCNYILDVPVIFTTPNLSGEVGSFDGTIQQWLEITAVNNELNSKDIKTALHQIFTHERYKTVLEIRSTDRPPIGLELAPVAFWLALMEQGKTRNILLEEVSCWPLSERIDLNLKVSTLDMKQSAVNGKTILQALEWLAGLVYDSLDERSERLNIESERKYIEPFFESVFSKDVFSLQTQQRFAKQNIPIKEFILEKTTYV